MIMDKLLEFADGVSVAASAGTALIGDVINLQSIGRDIGLTERPLYLVVLCQTSIITAGSAGTIQFFLASDAQEAIDTGGAATIHLTSPAFVTDGDDANDLDAGAVIFRSALPQANSVYPYEQYLGILATVASQTVTAGAIDAFLTFDPPNWKALPDAQN